MDLLQSAVPVLAELLDPTTLARIESKCRWRTYRAGQLVHRRGDKTHGFSLIRSGRVSSANTGLDGSTVTTSILGPGQCFGEFTLFAGLPRTHDVIAIDEVEIGTAPEKAFLALCEDHPAITRALLTISLRRSYVLVEFLDGLRRLPLDMRVAKSLLAQGQHADQARVDCTQEDLAFTFGVTRISINKVLARLEQAGFIKRRYKHILITDIVALRDWVRERDLVVPLLPAASHG